VAGGGDARRPTSWRSAVHRWRDYIRDRRDTAAIFENEVSGQRVEGGDAHRFDPEYADKQYAKLKDLERGLRAEYGRRLHTAMLTFTASSTDDDGNPRPPVDHLDDLLSSWSAVTRSLRRVMEGRRWERLAILEPHESGYLHVHVAVFVDGVTVADEFRPVLEAHLRNCEGAGEQAHRVEGDRAAVSVKHVGGGRDDGTIANLGTYLAEYLGTYGDDPLEAAEHVQQSNAVLWSTGRRRWRPSNGAQTYMATNRGGDDEPSPWRLVAIRDGDEEHEVESTGGGVERFTTGPRANSRPPPDCGDLPEWCQPY